MNSKDNKALDFKVLGLLTKTLVALAVWLFMPLTAYAETWRTVENMPADFKQLFDPASNTPRHPEFDYMPAERYPFDAPYTVEEMGYRSAEFPHVSRWEASIADVFGVVTSSGYINQGVTVFYLGQNTGPGFKNYLYGMKAGNVYARWMTYDVFPPENEGTQQLWTPYRTDKSFRTKMDFFVYSPTLRRVRRQPEPRRDQRFPDNAQTFDDVVGRDPWEFEWQLLGTDVIFETVLYPNTRPTITLNKNGKFVEVATSSLKMMGAEFPRYTAEGGIACWVVKATARQDWLPGYQEKYLILWLEKGSFFPLRREKYDLEGKLMNIEVRIAEMTVPERGEFGYSSQTSIYWNIPNDLISYSFHDPHVLKSFTAEEKAMLFNAEFMRRDWLYEPLKSQVLIDDPDQYFLRPKIYPKKFPAHRNTAIPPAVAERYRLQDEAGHLVFESSAE